MILSSVVQNIHYKRIGKAFFNPVCAIKWDTACLMKQWQGEIVERGSFCDVQRHVFFGGDAIVDRGVESFQSELL